MMRAGGGQHHRAHTLGGRVMQGGDTALGAGAWPCKALAHVGLRAIPALRPSLPQR